MVDAFGCLLECERAYVVVQVGLYVFFVGHSGVGCFALSGGVMVVCGLLVLLMRDKVTEKCSHSALFLLSFFCYWMG